MEIKLLFGDFYAMKNNFIIYFFLRWSNHINRIHVFVVIYILYIIGYIEEKRRHFILTAKKTMASSTRSNKIIFFSVFFFVFLHLVCLSSKQNIVFKQSLSFRLSGKTALAIYSNCWQLWILFEKVLKQQNELKRTARVPYS